MEQSVEFSSLHLPSRVIDDLQSTSLHICWRADFLRSRQRIYLWLNWNFARIYCYFNDKIWITQHLFLSVCIQFGENATTTALMYRITNNTIFKDQKAVHSTEWMKLNHIFPYHVNIFHLIRSNEKHSTHWIAKQPRSDKNRYQRIGPPSIHAIWMMQTKKRFFTLFFLLSFE